MKILRKQCISYIVDIRLLKKLVQYFVFIHQNMTISVQARRQREAGGQCPPIYFLFPHGIFLGGRSCFFWPEKTLKFVISVRKSLRISAKSFFFLEIICFWPEKKLKFRPENAFGNRRKPLPPPPPISRSWRRPCQCHHRKEMFDDDIKPKVSESLSA